MHCGEKIIWYDNIPLFGFLRLRGLSRCCRRPIPQDYFWVELAGGFLFLLVALYHLNLVIFNPVFFARDLFFICILLVIFLYDAKYQLILTGVVAAGGLGGFIFNLFTARPFTTYILLFNHNAAAIASNLALGAIVGWGWFAFQYYASRGKWVGGGDVRLGAMLGLWLGWPLILVCLFFSYILGALVAVPLLILKKKQFGSALPFGTFLAVGAVITIFYGQPIFNWYLRFLG